MQRKLASVLFIAIGIISLQMDCSKNNENDKEQITSDTIYSWITKADSTVLLQKQAPLYFTSTENSNASITVDSTQTFQTIDGFGYSLTGGSAYTINTLDATAKNNLLQELFGNGDNSIHVSYLRISIGASDLNASVFSYDDVPGDTALTHFSLSKDETDLIAVLKEVVAINPSLKIMGTPWSPPVWMKNNNNSVGGSLLPQYYNVYARYLVKYIEAMKAEGITIDAITPQNEPLYGGNNPSMVMTADEAKNFIKNNLGPAFSNAGTTTKIICYDHNCDRPDYPITILSDTAAAKYVDGSAFHLYGGDVSALSTVHNAYPDKNVYFTEQWTGSKEKFDGNLMWHIKNIIIGTMNNWSRAALEWNLANDANFQPHTTGGCNECKGALTISSGVNRNVAYYIIAHAAKFIPAGSVRIASTQISNLSNVAFKTPQGKKVLIVLNDGSATATFNLSYKNKIAVVSLPAQSTATYVW